jgi:hypothetical protein
VGIEGFDQEAEAVGCLPRLLWDLVLVLGRDDLLLWW